MSSPGGVPPCDARSDLPPHVQAAEDGSEVLGLDASVVEMARHVSGGGRADAFGRDGMSRVGPLPTGAGGQDGGGTASPGESAAVATSNDPVLDVGLEVDGVPMLQGVASHPEKRKRRERRGSDSGKVTKMSNAGCDATEMVEIAAEGGSTSYSRGSDLEREREQSCPLGGEEPRQCSDQAERLVGSGVESDLAVSTFVLGSPGTIPRPGSWAVLHRFHRLPSYEIEDSHPSDKPEASGVDMELKETGFAVRSLRTKVGSQGESVREEGSHEIWEDGHFDGAADGLRCQTDWKDLPKSKSGIIHFIGDSVDRLMVQPLAVVSRIAHAKTPYEWLNVVWLLLIAFLSPAIFGILWFGAIPISMEKLECQMVPADLREDSESEESGCDHTYIRDCAEGHFGDKAAWAFVVNPGTYVFFSYNLIIIFLGCLDEARPWRPFKSYLPILVTSYVVQVGLGGLPVFFSRSFKGVGLVALGASIAVTLAGLRLTPHQLFDTSRGHYMKIYCSFVRILCVFFVFWLLMLLYIIANAHSQGVGQGFLTFGLAIVTFIFKKILLSMTDTYPLEMAMVISGLWLENLVDLFIILAYPTATRLGPTFAVIWVTRVAEDIAYLGFQLDAWFKFRVWVKGVLGLAKSRSYPIEDDINLDDRGHSNIHPGYRRRQMRFLAWKLLSQLSSSICFLALIPILRFGQNKDYYPFSFERVPVEFRGVSLDAGFGCFTKKEFKASMIFAALSMTTFFVSGCALVWYMSKYHNDILHQLVDRGKELIVSHTYFGFVLTVLVSNVLLAVSAVQFYNRLFYF